MSKYRNDNHAIPIKHNPALGKKLTKDEIREKIIAERERKKNETERERQREINERERRENGE